MENTLNVGEIVIYQPNERLKLDVRVENETVWLTQVQMAELFASTKQNISLHISNIYKEVELDNLSTVKEYLTVQKEGDRTIKRNVKYYNLDVIISVGYRVKSINGTRFRQWANNVLKEYVLKGYSINQRFERLEQRVLETEKKVDFFVQTALPPIQGVFFDGQIFDAYKFANDLIRSANTRIILIDNYVDDTVLAMLCKRKDNVSATIFTSHISEQLQLDVEKHNSQYQPIEIKRFKQSHDRFLIIDDSIYLIGASLKDLGKKWLGFSLLQSVSVEELIDKLT